MDAELALLRTAVVEAGAAAMAYFGRDPQVWEKEGHGPVTEADLEANAVLERHLRRARPDFGWLSEETTDTEERLSRRAVWIVDPIDGTRAFIDGKPEFTICAALAVDGEILAGAVFNPVTSELFCASRSNGATLNDARLSIARQPPLDKARVLGARRIGHGESWRGPMPSFTRGYVNSIAYRLCLVASGEWNACVALNSFSEWDVAAAEIIVAEAGGRITDRAGAAFRYNQPQTRVPGLIAAHPELHREIGGKLLPPLS